MAAMLVIVLVLCLCKGLEGAVPQQRDQPQQWTEFEASINQRLAIMERQLTDKDVQIRNLETKLESHIAVYSKYVTDNEREIQRKNIEINLLKERVKILTPNVNCVSSQDADNDGSVHTSDAVQINGDQTITGSEYSERKSRDDVLSSPRHSQTRVTQPSSVVAFHSELTQSPTVSTGNTVVFNHETIDEGQGYDPVDGIYIVPETGTYVLVWVMFAEFHQHIQTLLMVNGAVRGSSLSDAQENHDLHQATSVVVLRLNQGDHVFIKVGHTSVTTVTFHYEPTYNGASTFSGWKLT